MMGRVPKQAASRRGQEVGVNLAKLSTTTLSYRIYGDVTSSPLLVIEPALAASSAEWWHIAEGLSNRYAVLLYDRAGYGRSSSSTLPRTPHNIAVELRSLLVALKLGEKQATLLGHSQGGLYAQQYAVEYPDAVHSLLLLDPLTAEDSRFRSELGPKEFRKCSVDKSGTLKLGAAVSAFRLGFLFRPLLLKSPPFYYKADFSPEASQEILRNSVLFSQYKASIAEYRLSHDAGEIAALRTSAKLLKCPLMLITHSSRASVDEWVTYVGMDKAFAERIEDLWQDIMRTCLALSTSSAWRQSDKATHYIHLTDPGIMYQALDEIAPGRVTPAN
jgi:pimeloyl-ACP methyl ester carboxylesterase